VKERFYLYIYLRIHFLAYLLARGGFTMKLIKLKLQGSLNFIPNFVFKIFYSFLKNTLEIG